MLLPGDSATVQFTTRVFATGVSTNADALPTGVLVRNGTDTAEAVTVTNVTTGTYKVAVTIPAGYAVADVVEIRIAATVSTVSDKAVVWSAVLDTRRVSQLNNLSAAQVNAEADTALADVGLTGVVTGRIDAAITTRASAADYTSARAGYLDNINVGQVASQADVLALNQSASRRVVLSTSPQYERPDVGSVGYEIELRTYDPDGAVVNATGTPTLTATGTISGNLNANLSAASNPATGVYRWTYTDSFDATIEQIRLDASAVLADGTFTISAFTQVADFVAATFTTVDRATINSLASQASVDAIATTGGPGPWTRNTEPANPDLSSVVTWATRGLTMIELDGVVYRLTANALEQGVGGGFDPDVDTIYVGVTWTEFFKRVGATSAGGSTGATTSLLPDIITHTGMDGVAEVVSTDDVAGNRSVTYP